MHSDFSEKLVETLPEFLKADIKQAMIPSYALDADVVTPDEGLTSKEAELRLKRDG
jgi:hypothetical protein